MALLKTANHIWAWARSIHLRNGSNSGQASKYLDLDYRVKGSTLMETLVATVLIVILFMVSSMILNNMLSGNIRQHTELAEERMNVLEYQYHNEGLTLPYYEDFESWEITVTQEQRGDQTLVLIEAENPTTKKTVTNYISNEK